MGSAVSFLHNKIQPNPESEMEVSDNCDDEYNGLYFKKSFIPEEIVNIILSYLDCVTLLDCRLVCRSWKDIIDNSALKLKSKSVNSLKHLNHNTIGNLPWYVFYAICKKDPFNRNHLLNGCGQNGMKHWSILLNGGNKWIVEDTPKGSDPVPEEAMEFEGHQSCFATSYYECKKQQVIPLLKCGFTSKILDEMQPDIEIGEWHAGRFDCGCYYHFKVSLLDEKEQEIDEFHVEKTINQWQGRSWIKISNVFRRYGKGVRYIRFSHAGRDSQFWEGHYGPKISGGYVVLRIPED